MAFDLNKLKNSASTLKEATDGLANLGMEKAQEVLAEINLLLQLLQQAGYVVANLDFELNLPPKVTIKLKTGPAVKEEKLGPMMRDHADKKVVTAVIGALIQANRLRSSVTVETLELGGVEIGLTTAPNITLQWKDKQEQRAVAAA
jgi:hypothetical protein